MAYEAEIERLLQEKFHYQHFREGQQTIIEHLLAGQNTLAILPTGTGKSLCYQLTGYLLSGTVLVVSPLISLMEDQVRQLQLLGEKRVIAYNSQLSPAEKQLALKHLSHYKFIFISPEMLLQPVLLQALQQLTIALAVIDEAHCISMWGNDFRPEYRQIGSVLARLGQPRLLGLTATATPQVIQDIRQLLFAGDYFHYQQAMDRQNISYFVRQTPQKKRELQQILTEIRSPGIIYCSTRKHVEELYHLLAADFSVGYYHGGLDISQRRQLQQQFGTGRLDWLIATNAFGMGINKGDIRTVIHYDLPDSIENYVQEVGRAGRDGQPSQALLLYTAGDEGVHYYFQRSLQAERLAFEGVLAAAEVDQTAVEHFTPLQDKWFQEVQMTQESQPLLQRLMIHETEKNQKLAAMLHFIQTEGCRRQFLSAYFGESTTELPAACCDHHEARLLRRIEKKSQQPKQKKLQWQEILLKLFKEKNKVDF